MKEKLTYSAMCIADLKVSELRHMKSGIWVSHGMGH
jgi:hypothetical protein